MPQNITITIAGKAQTDLERDLVEVIVDTHYSKPAMVTMLVQDEFSNTTEQLKYADDAATIDIGKEIKIEVETWAIHETGKKVKDVLFDGEITSIEPIFSSTGVAQLAIRGYDRAHRLMRGVKTRTFLKKTAADVVKSVAGECGLSAVCDTCSTTYDYILQSNQSNWEFIQERAWMEGFQVYVDAKKLYFKKAETARGSAEIDLEYGTSLSSFEPRITSMGQITKATANGWDPGKKEAVTSTVSSSAEFSKIGYGKKGSAAVNAAFSEAEDYVTDIPLRVQGVAKSLATARMNETESSFIQGSGALDSGDPRIRAGVKLNLKKLGNRFSGKYYVTECRHVWSGGQYAVTFTATGLNGLNHYRPGSEQSPDTFARHYGVFPALVTNNDDPDKMGRVKVKYPWMPKAGGAEVESDWARLASPMAGPERGMCFIPEVNDEVLVAFEQGDIHYPYVVGTLWNGKDKLPKGTGKPIAEGGKVNQRVIRSRTGHIIVLDDTQGEEQIIIKDKTEKNSIILTCKDNKMTFACEGDMVFNAKGKVTVSSQSDVSFEAKGKTTIKSTGDLSLEATSKANFKGGNSQLGLEMAGTTMKGLKVDITADTQAALKGNAMVQIQGAMVKIN